MLFKYLRKFDSNILKLDFDLLIKFYLQKGKALTLTFHYYALLVTETRDII